MTARAFAAQTDAQLRWGLQPGQLETYNITIDRRSSLQTYATRQEGRLTRMILAASQPDQWNSAQMLELARGRAVRIAGTAPPTTAPSGRILALLPLPHTQLTVGIATTANAPLIVPGGSPFEKDLMRALLEWGDWPDQNMSVDTQWSREFVGTLLKGTRRFRVEAFEKKPKSESVARIQIVVDLKGGSTAPGAWKIVQADGTIRWGLRSQRVLEFRGHAVFARMGPAAEERIELNLLVAPKSRTVVSTAEHNTAQTQIVELAAAIRDYNADRLADAVADLKRFVRSSPHSRWRPVADFLAAQITAELAGQNLTSHATASAPGAGLRDRLAALLADWHAATRQGDPERIAQSRKALERAARVNRTQIAQFTESGDESERALACLGLAFAAAPADVAVLSTLSEDASAVVRESAYYGLAIFGSPLVRADVLSRGGGDSVGAVRVRACEAVAACIRPDSPDAEGLADELAGRLADESPRVRAAAARALAAMGRHEQIDLLERTVDDPANESIRPALQAALKDMKTRFASTRPVR